MCIFYFLFSKAYNNPAQLKKPLFVISAVGMLALTIHVGGLCTVLEMRMASLASILATTPMDMTLYAAANAKFTLVARIVLFTGIFFGWSATAVIVMRTAKVFTSSSERPLVIFNYASLGLMVYFN
jgi:hypothetical protein